MNIGVVNQKIIQVGSGEGKKQIPYLEMLIRPPFMQWASFTISQNKKKAKENEPDWNIYYSFNGKGEKYPRTRCGAIWDKIKDDLKYKTGYVDMVGGENGRLNITLFQAKHLEGQDPESITWAYDVVWNHYKGENEESTTSSNNSNATPSYGKNETPIPEIDIDMDQIPF